MATDREEEAMKVLRKLHYNGSNGTGHILPVFESHGQDREALTVILEEWLEAEFNEIKQTLAAEKAVTVPGWKIMFTVPQWRTRLMHGVAVQVFTQLSGISQYNACIRVSSRLNRS